MKTFAQTPASMLQNSQDSLLQQIAKQASLLQGLQQQLEKHLPKAMRSHCQVLHISQGRLQLAVDSNAWASKLHFMKSELLSNLRQEKAFAGLTGIDHKVEPLAEIKGKAAPKPRGFKLSADSQSCVESLMAQTDNTELKQKLQAFLTHYKR